MKTPLTSTQSVALRGLFAASFLVVVLAIVFFVVGCQAPRWMVGQKKVPTAESAPPIVTTEAQKKGAAFIRNRTRPPVADPKKVVEEVHEVASGLVASLGEPKDQPTVEDYAKTVAALQQGLQAKDAQLERWREFGRKYGGKPLEDTGINLAGPAGLVGLLAVIALCVAFPSIGYLVLRLLPVLWGYFRRTTEAISEFATGNPDAGRRLATTLGNKMDRVHKKLVRKRAGKLFVAADPLASSSPA